MQYTKQQELENIYETAIEQFPYKLSSTSITQGELESDEKGFIEYSEEFTFDIGQLADKSLIAGGWIDFRRDTPEDELAISGLFVVALEGDFENEKILSDEKALLGYYDIKSQSWELNIDFY